MPANHPYTPLNPTVEEVPDESDRNNDGPDTDFRFSWLQICTRHDSVLSSHLNMLQGLKDQVSSDAEASRVISSMIERTNKLVMQFDGVKKHIVPQYVSNNWIGAARGLDSSKVGDGNDFPRTTPSKPEDGAARKRRKRQRISNSEIESEVEPREPVPDVQRLKRKRIDMDIAGADEDVQDAIPVSLDTEDISDEVQRRLEIKEEQRRKRDDKPTKRRRERDSLASNTSSSSLGTSKPRKKFKLSGQVNR